LREVAEPKIVDLARRSCRRKEVATCLLGMSQSPAWKVFTLHEQTKCPICFYEREVVVVFVAVLFMVVIGDF
jgi:hypothetical protein